MPDEFSLYGILVPTLLVLAVISYLIWLLLRALLVRFNLYRHVWHPALFDVAVYMLVLGASFYLFIPAN